VSADTPYIDLNVATPSTTLLTSGPRFNPKYALSGRSLITSLLADVVRSLVIAWGLDAVRPAAGMGWLPHVTWWQTFIALLILGSLLGSLTEAVMGQVARWWTK
jgi:hypothetical protein